MTLFDAYVMVDWSAASKPKRGSDSIWCATLVGGWRDAHLACRNAATRAEALVRIEATLAALRADGRRVLIGFDFPLGYPRGWANALKLLGPPWRATWEAIAETLKDDDDNRNNRFKLAAALNRQAFNREFPFWGHPPTQSFRCLGPRKPKEGYGALPERRACERRDMTKRAQSCWKLSGAGAVGGQALTGIPAVRALRERFAEARVWPFETGFAAPDAPIVIAEIYPSLFPAPPKPDEVKDRAQVRVLARRFARLDRGTALAKLFAGPADFASADRAAALAEEGWILGVA